jgi:ADP-heptose:LPS heptosyltransferase
MPRKLLLKNFQSPGDIVMLTAAVRAIHDCCPGDFLTDVRTSCPDLWSNNPYITPLEEAAPDVHTIECHYPLIHQSNQRPYHFIHGFIEYLAEKLHAPIAPLRFKGDIHLSANERLMPDKFVSLNLIAAPFWLIVAGGKFDFTTKWWAPDRYQSVVDHFQGRIRFVQVGEVGHHHPPLKGVVDLRGQTTLRELIRLVHHAQGVLCPVTLLMHLAAAVPTQNPLFPLRPCVVVAGGREPPHWEAYPAHQFIHTVGMLECCRDGGCWRSRVLPIGDGDEKDFVGLCANVVGSLPRCMDMITAEHVISRIDGYFQGGTLSDCTRLS